MFGRLVVSSPEPFPTTVCGPVFSIAVFGCRLFGCCLPSQPGCAMNLMNDLYGGSLALMTDLYQFTMAQGYWKNGMHGREAVFQLFFRDLPFGGGYCVASGIHRVLDVTRVSGWLPAYNTVPEALDHVQGKKS